MHGGSFLHQTEVHVPALIQEGIHHSPVLLKQHKIIFSFSFFLIYNDMSVKRSFDTHLISGLLRSYAASAIRFMFYKVTPCLKIAISWNLLLRILISFRMQSQGQNPEDFLKAHQEEYHLP